MGLSIHFLDEDGLPQQVITLTEQDGDFLLPRLRISSDRSDAWVEDCSIVGTSGPGLTPILSRSVTEIWESSMTSGSTPLLSAPARIRASTVPVVAHLLVRWVVRYRDDGFYDGLMNDTDPQDIEASVSLVFEPGARRSGAPPGFGAQLPVENPITSREQLVENREPAHKGHVAIDFGTSNCTVTLLDQQVLPPHVLSVQQVNDLRRGLLALLKEPRQFGAVAQLEFEECIADVASIVLETVGDGGSLRGRLQELLSSEDDGDPTLLYATLVELERRVQQGSADLRPRLADSLAELYAHAWRVAPLDRLRLFPVELDIAEGAELESKVSVTLDPWRVRVGRPLGLGGQQRAQEPFVYAGLKQRLGKEKGYPELGPGITSGTLLRDSLGDLLRRSNAYIATGPAELGSGQIDNVVMTYPTMASPAMRHKLRDMLRQLGISRVDLSYDEAIAAAMFFLLRDFGGDHDIGLEVLRARSRPVPGRSDQWVQNMLVIDIGGGTADIALVTLTLVDTTPAGLDPHLHGRYYEVRPEVRGSTGRLQQGGELMTLRIFSWLKASIADRLHQELPERFAVQRSQLEQLNLGDLDKYPLTSRILRDKSSHGSSVHRVLDSIVPTMSPSGTNHPGQTFWLLWSLAERKKFELCATECPAKVLVSALDVRSVLRSVDQMAQTGEPLDQAAELQDDHALELELDADKFESLVSPELNGVIAAAHDLATRRLGTGDSAEPLDRVILTGQASKAPLVRRLVQAKFVGVDKGKNALRCRPTAIVVEREYAKRATSVGSCWATSIRSLAPSPQGAIPRLMRGHNELYLDVKNLFFHLPCDFSVGTTPGGGGEIDAEKLLKMGTELYQLSPGEDVSAVRSGDEPWPELTDYLNVYRQGHGKPSRWGAFQWEEQSPDLSREIWPRQVHYLVEATSALDLFLLLCRGGKPHYLVDGPSIPAVGREHERLFRLRGSDGQALPAGHIVVNAYVLDGAHEGEPVFSVARRDGADEFPEFFHSAGEASGTQGVRGVIGKALPEPPRNGTWTFHYRDEKGNLHQIGELNPPARRNSLRAQYYASLDERGNLRVHACSVPFWPAASLTDVQDYPGKVLRIPLPCPDEDEDQSKDPFNGQH